MWKLGQDVLWFYSTAAAPVLDPSGSYCSPILPSGCKYPEPATAAAAAAEIHPTIESGMMSAVYTSNRMTQHSHPIAVTLKQLT